MIFFLEKKITPSFKKIAPFQNLMFVYLHINYTFCFQNLIKQFSCVKLSSLKVISTLSALRKVADDKILCNILYMINILDYI